MKRLSIIATLISLLTLNTAKASGFFVGANALYANASHESKNISANSAIKNNDITESDNINYGLSAGIRADLIVFHVSAEAFYDNLNLSATNFRSDAGFVNSVDNVELKNRYGAKVNAGMMILPNITPFVSYGLAKVRYSSNILSSNSSLTKTELTPVYGFGLLVDLPFIGLSAKASYDYQSFDMKYAADSAKIKTHLGVTKLGLIYNF